MTDLTNEIDVNFLQHLPGMPPLRPEDARTLAEDLARAGADPKAINEHLRGMGVAELDVSPAAEAQRTLDRLKADSGWVAKLNSGDVETNTTFNRLTLAISQRGAQAEPAPKAEDYQFDLRRVEDPDVAAKMHTETAAWAADLKLPKDTASAITAHVLDNTERTALMSPDEKANHGHHQEEMLRAVLAKQGEPDAILKAARETLRKASGRDIDIAAVARSSGAQVANELVLHALALAYRA